MGFFHLKTVTQNISETGRFIKFLNGCHLEMKKDFDLKICMMIDRP
jgi:hypothetical protein